MSATVTVADVAYNQASQQLTFNVTAQLVSATQAARVSSLLDIMGVNLFPIADVNDDPWGAWPSDDSPATVVSCMEWLGIKNIRCYWNTWRSGQFPSWLPAVVPQLGAEVTLCIGATGSSADAPGLLALATAANGVQWVEGVNEPNTNFGNGAEPVATVQAAQAALQAGLPAGVTLMGPSIAGGLPNPEGWFTGYMSTDAAAILADMTAASLHLYPPTLCDIDDGSGRGGAFDDYIAGAAIAYPNKQPYITEWHPTLYNNSSPALARSVLDTYDPLYALVFLLSAQRLGVTKAWYYALHDFATQYLCGLFKSGSTDPRPVAYAIRALNTLAGDAGATRSTFTPGALAYTVSGLPGPVNAASPHSGGQSRLFQGSDGKFRLLVWNAQVTPGGASVPVTITFAGTPPASVVEYNLTTGDATSTTALQTLTNAASITTQLNASVHLFVITP